MKNYELNSEKAKTFVLNYRIVKEKDEDKIIITLADGSEYPPIPYTIENEQKILRVMKKQVMKLKNCEVYINDLKKCKNVNSNIFKLCLLVFVSLSGIYALLSMNVSVQMLVKILVKLFFIFFSLPFVIMGIKSLKETIKMDKTLKDLEKNIDFIDNEKLLNEIEREIVLKNVSEKTTYMVKQKDKPITINDVDKIPVKDLNVMIENAINYKAVEDTLELDLNPQVNERVRIR